MPIRSARGTARRPTASHMLTVLSNPGSGHAHHCHRRAHRHRRRRDGAHGRDNQSDQQGPRDSSFHLVEWSSETRSPLSDGRHCRTASATRIRTAVDTRGTGFGRADLGMRCGSTALLDRCPDRSSARRRDSSAVRLRGHGGSQALWMTTIPFACAASICTTVASSHPSPTGRFRPPVDSALMPTALHVDFVLGSASSRLR